MVSGEIEIISPSKRVCKIDDLSPCQARSAFDIDPTVLPFTRNCVSMRSKERIFLQKRKKEVRDSRTCIPFPHIDETKIYQSL